MPIRFADTRHHPHHVSPTAVVALTYLLPLLAISGCRTAPPIVERPGESTLFAKSQLSQDSVVLEVTFVDAPQAEADWEDRVWGEIDEQGFPPESRRKLQANGFRCGTIGHQLPVEIRELIDAQQGTTTDLANEDGISKTLERQSRRIQARSGRRSEVITFAPRESLIVLLNEADGVVGKTFRDAQTVFELKAYPLGDGRRIELVPEIQFGPVKQKYVGRDGMFELEVGREKRDFSHLKINATITPGHTLAVSSTSAGSSLGGCFFGDGDRQKLLLVRLAQSQQDDLFDLADESVREAEDKGLLGLTTELD